MLPPSPKQKKQTEIWGVLRGGGTYPSPKGVGLECVPPSSIPSLLPLQISCSLVVARLICNSCAPPPPPPPLPQFRLREIKRAPVPRLLPRWAYGIWLGVNEKVQNTGENMPSFFLRYGLEKKIKPPSSPSQGLCCFPEHWTDSDLHCNSCAPPHIGTFPKFLEDDKKMQNNSEEQGV